MEINIELTRKDYADFNQYWFLKTKLRSRIYIIISFALVFALVLNVGEDFSLTQFLIDTIIFGLPFAAIYFILILIGLRATGKMPSEKGSVLGKKKFIIEEEGLVEETEFNRNVQKWNGIMEIDENKNAILIFVDNMAAYIIPKRFFKNEDEKVNFLAALKEKTPHNNGKDEEPV